MKVPHFLGLSFCDRNELEFTLERIFLLIHNLSPTVEYIVLSYKKSNELPLACAETVLFQKLH